MIITLQTLIFFRESLLTALDRLLRPYYNKLSLALGRKGEIAVDEEAEEQVFAEYDDERGVVFYPPMYLQRYAAVSDCLMDGPWSGKLEKVVDLGYHDMSFIKYLKEVQGIKCILGVDLETIPLRCSMDLVGCDDYAPKREKPLDVTLFKGNAADPDYRLIGCDAVIAIEMIEHMLPHDLDRLIHTVFGFIKPWVAIFTTPNGDFNVLFKAMEKNGLRRLDHFFEWSRDQFHDWCSNIVVRYPQYSVSCKGIGPGPGGSQHLGCCSQMAVFVAREYCKQPDLNLNSLALVADTPSPLSISNLISSWETCDIPIECNMIEPPKNAESYPELVSNMQSSITIYLSSASNSDETIPYHDKMSQCNLDSETEKGFLMFDYEEMCCDVVEPNRQLANHRVYDIEDVYNRLNCTTLEVKKFSKATQNLMAKNKVDTLVHTREVVDEIKHLTKMLNFNKDVHNQIENGTHTWCNINWGENAPYWNQYYKIVKAYNYPFEVKSEECRILDLISDEINRLVDSQIDEDFSFELNRLEIPIERLMREVAHITDDVDKVKDILEWNGYEVQGDMVVHSRMVVDYSSAGTQEDESLDTSDIYSDWDSTSMSDGSTIVPDYNAAPGPLFTGMMAIGECSTGSLDRCSTARCLRRALDQKVRRLRSMLTADEDITTELDRVVCRLMKLALRSSKGRNNPPPTRWMQCKLLDLLTLTEKSIERRKRHFIESYELKSINFEEKSVEMAALEKIKEDDTALKIVDKYKHLVNEKDGETATYRILDFEIDGLTDSSTEYAKEYEIVDKDVDDIQDLTTEDIAPDTQISNTEVIIQQDVSKLERTQAWLEEEIEVVPYPVHDGIVDNSSIETEHIATNITKYYKKKYKGKQCIELNCLICKKTHSKTHKHHKKDEKTKEKSVTKLAKKVTRKKSSNYMLGQYTQKKYVSVDYKTVKVKSRRKQKNVYPGLDRPISVNHVQVGLPKIMMVNKLESFTPKTDVINEVVQEKNTYVVENEVAATKESMFVEIITENTQETIALKRTIGTDADEATMVFDDEKLIRSVSNTLMHEEQVFDKPQGPNEIIDSQTIFLYNIDEPTTSKGIRHVSMDAQCGPDTTAPTYSLLSATTSLTRVPKIYSTGIKIGNSGSQINSADFATSTYDSDNNYRILHGNRFVGIKIKDSDVNLLVDNSVLNAMPGNSKDEALATPTYKAGTNTPEFVYNTIVPDVTGGIKMKGSVSNISLHEGSLSDHYFINPADSVTLEQPYDKITEPENTLTKVDSTLSTQEMYDKIIVTSQRLFERDADVHLETGKKIEYIDPNMPVIPMNLDPAYVDASAKKTIKEQGIQRKTVEFVLQETVLENIEPISTEDIIQGKCDTINSPTEQLVSENVEEKTPERDTSSISDLYLVPITEFSGPLASLTENQNDESEKEKMYLKPRDDVSACYSTSNIMDNHHTADMRCNHLQVTKVKITDISIGTKYGKQQLSSGGVQVNSYKDQQGLSEDIMCQGMWQKQNKVSNKKKCLLPVAANRNDLNSKNLKVLTKTSILKENISIKDRNVIDIPKKEVKEPAPCKVFHPNVKQERRITKTACAATVAKPFRNIIKAPATFPISRLPPKSLKSPPVAKKSPVPPASPKPKDEKPVQRKLRKNYIPPYLRRRVLNAASKEKPDVKLSSNPIKPEVKSDTEIKEKENIPQLIRSKTEEINRDLIKFQPKPKTEFIVYRNEIEKKDRLGLKSTPGSARKKDATRQRSATAISTNSSTCSSPSSVATVKAVPTRAKNVANRRHSGPSYVNSTDNSGSENSTPERNKKFTRRIKNRVAVDNKENIPETSKIFNVGKKDSDKLCKNNFSTQKNVYIAQVKDSSIILATNVLSKTKNKLGSSNTNVKIKSHTDIKSLTDTSTPIAKKSSDSLNLPLSMKSNEADFAQTSNMVVVIDPPPRQMTPDPTVILNHSKDVNQNNVPKTTENTDNLESTKEDIAMRHSNQSIHSQMKGLIEDSLDFIDDEGIDTETIILKCENSTSADDLPASPASFKTVITNNDNYVNELSPSDIEYALNNSLAANYSSGSVMSLNDTRLTTDFDTLSFKSVTSGSKLSGYLSADNEFSSSIKLPKCTNREPSSTSVRDIFERREQPYQPAQTEPGAIANLVFSGFTINEEAVAGDQPDLIRLVNPTTGSLEAITRQATSEELLISGRSSSSFDSCMLDEGAVVPNWLFQIISQQHSGVVDLDNPGEVIVQVPIGEPLYDDNGNAVEAAVAGAGAGDGRGIHSDHSQDSSGQGSSVSSSESSSPPHSQALLIDPAAFAAQFELLRESIDGSITLMAVDNAEHVDDRQASTDADQQSFSRGEPPRTRADLTSASDADADVSSLETDAEDPHTDP